MAAKVILFFLTKTFFTFPLRNFRNGFKMKVHFFTEAHLPHNQNSSIYCLTKHCTALFQAAGIRKNRMRDGVGRRAQSLRRRVPDEVWRDRSRIIHKNGFRWGTRSRWVGYGIEKQIIVLCLIHDIRPRMRGRPCTCSFRLQCKITA